jgi:hypothetical protein
LTSQVKHNPETEQDYHFNINMDVHWLARYTTGTQRAVPSQIKEEKVQLESCTFKGRIGKPRAVDTFGYR